LGCGWKGRRKQPQEPPLSAAFSQVQRHIWLTWALHLPHHTAEVPPCIKAIAPNALDISPTSPTNFLLHSHQYNFLAATRCDENIVCKVQRLAARELVFARLTGESGVQVALPSTMLSLGMQDLSIQRRKEDHFFVIGIPVSCRWRASPLRVGLALPT
jgi:hypothetical protein